MAVSPPSTTSTVPFTKLMAGEHEAEDGVGHFFGMGLAIATQRHPAPGERGFGVVGMAAVIPVRIGPGHTQFTVTPLDPSSTTARARTDHTVLRRRAQAR